MTTTEVLDRFAQAFGQNPMLQSHGRYQCGGCGGWFGVGDVSVVLWPGGGQFRCGGCSTGGGVGALADAEPHDEWQQMELNAATTGGIEI